MKNLKSLWEEEKLLLEFLYTNKEFSSFSELQEKANDLLYQMGRIGMIEDLIKQEFEYDERTFQIRKKKGTLFEKTKT